MGEHFFPDWRGECECWRGPFGTESASGNSEKTQMIINMINQRMQMFSVDDSTRVHPHQTEDTVPAEMGCSSACCRSGNNPSHLKSQPHTQDHSKCLLLEILQSQKTKSSSRAGV